MVGAIEIVIVTIIICCLSAIMIGRTFMGRRHISCGGLCFVTVVITTSCSFELRLILLLMIVQIIGASLSSSSSFKVFTDDQKYQVYFL